MITNAGSGYSKCQGLDVTRWREDATCEAWGQFCYVRDVQRDLVWSAGYQPVCRPPEGYEVIFAADKATIRRRDADIETLLEVTVSPEQPVEVRRITLTNHDSRQRELELTSYVEVVAGSARERPGPPGVRQAVPGNGMATRLRRAALLRAGRDQTKNSQSGPCTSRPLTSQRPRAALVGGAQYETDRSRFLGRGRTAANPAALDHGAVLSGTTGPVLDPVLCLRHRVRLEPGGSAVIALATGSRRLAIRGAGARRSVPRGQRRLAGVRAGLGPQPGRAPTQRSFRRECPSVSTPGLAPDFRRIGTAGRPSGARRQPPGTRGLWRFGISGDRPIVLADFKTPTSFAWRKNCLPRRRYLRTKGLEFDLVLLERGAGRIRGRASQGSFWVSFGPTAAPTGSTNRAACSCDTVAVMREDERILLQAAARVVLVGDRGSLASQLDRTEWRHPLPALCAASHDRVKRDDEPVRLPA